MLKNKLSIYNRILFSILLIAFTTILSLTIFIIPQIVKNLHQKPEEYNRKLFPAVVTAQWLRQEKILTPGKYRQLYRKNISYKESVLLND